MNSINIGIDKAVLTRLLAQGHLCVSQLQALDPASKQALWQLCLDCSCEQTRLEGTVQAEPLHFRPFLSRGSSLGRDS